ncbi:MAG TPA: hypothetical protein PLS90_04510 [Candidatus Sumerlaeota bacterium]|nr:hypothetical protein [Candidatus Sumerlaeota bacterium]HPK01700.1 hypothetical protein [Candidatus Sumerlaeota bacterium]
MTSIPTPAARRRPPRGGILMTFVILLLVVMGVAGTVMWNRTREEKVIINRRAQTEPKMMLDRYFVLLGVRHRASDPDWQELLDFMSRDDRLWLDENRATLARLDPDLNGRNPLHLKPEAQTWSAVHALLDFGSHKVRPVVSTLRVNGVHAVAYIHDPGRIDTIRPIFLVQESGYWKLRRFGGARDSEPVMRLLVESKSTSGLPLTAEDQAWQRNPAAYEQQMQDALLREAGVDPNAQVQAN